MAPRWTSSERGRPGAPRRGPGEVGEGAPDLVDSSGPSSIRDVLQESARAREQPRPDGRGGLLDDDGLVRRAVQDRAEAVVTRPGPLLGRRVRARYLDGLESWFSRGPTAPRRLGASSTVTSCTAAGWSVSGSTDLPVRPIWTCSTPCRRTPSTRTSLRPLDPDVTAVLPRPRLRALPGRGEPARRRHHRRPAPQGGMAEREGGACRRSASPSVATGRRCARLCASRTSTTATGGSPRPVRGGCGTRGGVGLNYHRVDATDTVGATRLAVVFTAVHQLGDFTYNYKATVDQVGCHAPTSSTTSATRAPTTCRTTATGPSSTRW